MVDGAGKEKFKGKVTPSTFDIYCRKNGRWSLQACFLNEQAEEALDEAMRLDRECGFEGVRLMHTKFGSSSKSAVEIMVWVSPRLQETMFKPKKTTPKEEPSHEDEKIGKEERQRQQKKEKQSDIAEAAPPRVVAVPPRPERKAAKEIAHRLAAGPSQEAMTKGHVSGAQAVISSEKVPPAVTAHHRAAITDFAKQAMDAVDGCPGSRDEYTCFGIYLFLAGACQRYSQDNKLSNTDLAALIQEAATVAGANASTAANFAPKFADYCRTQKYKVMIECGRRAMAKAEADESHAFEEFLKELRQWSTVTSVAASAQLLGVVTLMFTDIVDSTRMTQEKGDYGAQEVVRAHNAIVRNALAAHNGHEVKHTGDGIMATFLQANGAIEAALIIQQGVAKHNAARDRTHFGVRIGLNSGDPIREEDDFFGAPVQIAARACAKASGGQVLVTESVRKLFSGQDIRFREMGKFHLKGIDHEVPLFEVNFEITEEDSA